MTAHAAFRTPQVQRTSGALERHRFLPGVDLKTAYARRIVVTKTGPRTASGLIGVQVLWSRDQYARANRPGEIPNSRRNALANANSEE